jgi:hypothetical protein
MPTATGTFQVVMTAQEDTHEPTIGRMTLAKTFQGDVEGTSQGYMLAAGTEVKGSAGYVALERVTGTLAGRQGSFALQHSGTMDRGTPSLSITVVPDSGTGALAGLTGRMTLDLAGGKHAYTLEYTLPE